MPVWHFFKSGYAVSLFETNRRGAFRSRVFLALNQPIKYSSYLSTNISNSSMSISPFPMATFKY